MEMVEFNEIDWEHLFNEFPENGFNFLGEPFSLEDEAATATTMETVDSWIEELLMKDDHHVNDEQAALSTDFLLSDVLLDSPQVLDALPSPEPQDKNSEGNLNTITCPDNDSPPFDFNGDTDKSGDDALELNDTDHDPISKKRKRQLRNRDAALRSRERKKMYVKDLEMKSHYLEAECRRLGRLLQCCYAENQMLRISLCSAHGASMAKPESAVLLLESLLLGSLVWFMVRMCLLPQPRLPLLNQDAVPLGSMERKDPESAAPRGKGKVTELWVTFSFMRSKRCRASRTRMKFDFVTRMKCF